MLKIIYKMSDLNIGQLKHLYSESIRNLAEIMYPTLFENLRIINAEQDFYWDIESFLSIKGAALALWTSEGSYVSCVRFEPIADGCLLTSFETHPEARGKGYGKRLLAAVTEYILNDNLLDIYSHVDENNIPSLNAHMHCGFERTNKPAVFVDGTVHNDHVTYVLQKKMTHR